jgi:hypothetical protein
MPMRTAKVNHNTRQPMIARIIIAGREAIAHLIIKVTIDPKGICTSVMMTCPLVSLTNGGIEVDVGIERLLSNNQGYFSQHTMRILIALDMTVTT